MATNLGIGMLNFGIEALCVIHELKHDRLVTISRDDYLTVYFGKLVDERTFSRSMKHLPLMIKPDAETLNLIYSKEYGYFYKPTLKRYVSRVLREAHFRAGEVIQW